MFYHEEARRLGLRFQRMVENGKDLPDLSFWWPCSETIGIWIPACKYNCSSSLFSLKIVLKGPFSSVFPPLGTPFCHCDRSSLSLRLILLCTLKLSTWKFLYMRQDLRLRSSFVLNCLQQFRFLHTTEATVDFTMPCLLRATPCLVPSLLYGTYGPLHW